MRWFYPVLVGLLFGTIQTGYFLRLSFGLTSTYGTFLMVTLSWLAGSVVGLRLERVRALSLRAGPWLTLVPFLTAQGLLLLLPFRSDLWPLYAVLVLVSGVFSGLFFSRLGAIIKPVRRLFFSENNGFILGIVSCSVIYLIVGQVSLWAIPTVLAALCWLWTPRATVVTLEEAQQPENSVADAIIGRIGK